MDLTVEDVEAVEFASLGAADSAADEAEVVEGLVSRLVASGRGGT